MMNNPLLVEIQRFAVGKNAYHREEIPESKKNLEIFIRCILNLFSIFSNSIFGETELEASRRTSCAKRFDI